MSTIYEKLALLPKRIPIKFQYWAGPTVEGTLILPCPSLKCLQIESGDKVRNIQHFINSYACHNDVKYLHFKTTEQIFLSFVVASGERTNKSFQTLLVDEPIPNDWLPFIGIVEPAIAKVQGILDRINVAEGKDVKAPIVMEMMHYLASVIPFIKRNPAFHATVIAKCEEFRKGHHGELPDVVAACTELLVALGQTPSTLISGDPLVLRQWTARLPEKIVMGLQVATGPRVKGIVYPKTNMVLTSFYPDPVPLQQWINKYCKVYELGKRALSLIDIIRYLRVGDHDIYTLLEHWKPSYLAIAVPATAEDEDSIRGIVKEEEEVLEASCDCRSCKQESRVDELYYRTNRLFCAFMAYDDADHCDCKRCIYEEGLNQRIRELEGQMNIVLKRLNLQEEKKENGEW